MFSGFTSKERPMKPLQFSMLNFVFPHSITKLKFKVKTRLTWHHQFLKRFFKIFKFKRIFSLTSVLRGSHEYRISANFELFSWLLSIYIVNNTMGLQSRLKNSIKRRQENNKIDEKSTEFSQVFRLSPLSFPSFLACSSLVSRASSLPASPTLPLKSKHLRRRQEQKNGGNEGLWVGGTSQFFPEGFESTPTFKALTLTLQEFSSPQTKKQKRG